MQLCEFSIAVYHYLKCNGLNRHLFIGTCKSSQAQLGLCLAFHKAELKMKTRLGSYLEPLGKNPLPSLSR